MPFGFLKKWFGKKETQKTIEEALKTESITVSQIEEKKVFPQKKTLQILSCQKNKTLKLKNIQVAQFISFLTKGNLRIELKIPYSGVNAREGRDFLEKEFEILREGLYGFPVPFSDLEIYPINHSLEVSFSRFSSGNRVLIFSSFSFNISSNLSGLTASKYFLLFVLM